MKKTGFKPVWIDIDSAIRQIKTDRIQEQIFRMDAKLFVRIAEKPVHIFTDLSPKLLINNHLYS